MENSAHQPSLLGPTTEQSLAPSTPEDAAGSAQVVIDSPLPHLDRLFDYLIPHKLKARARPGARVRVRFGHNRVEGVIISTAPSAPPGLKPLDAVVGDIPVLTDEVSQFCQRLADHYAGGLSDVLRLALPPRHARTEKQVLADPPAQPSPWNGRVEEQHWSRYQAGPAFLRRLARGDSPRAVWSALPTAQGDMEQHWAQAIAAATAATLRSGRCVLIILPTHAEIRVMAQALSAVEIPFLELSSEVGQASRYRNFLHCLLGAKQVVIGTRGAVYAPVTNLGLVVCWDEASSAYAEPRAPYPHAREALAMRAGLADSAVLFGGFSRTPQAHHLLTTGWAQQLQARRDIVRRATPRIHAPDEYDYAREGGSGRARIPSFVWRKIKHALNNGPVLIQVPRGGHIPSVACARCRETARCSQCAGPLYSPDTSLRCRWCTRVEPQWRCHQCSSAHWRARVVGAHRTAEELGRAFPNVAIHQSSKAAGVMHHVENKPMLVIATPGAEPVAPEGYELAVILDAHRYTDSPSLNAPIQALHAWLTAASLVSGEVFILGDPLRPPAQAAVRWDPAGYAQRELDEWETLGFPPRFTLITVTGEKADVVSFTRLLQLGEEVEVFGPVQVAGRLNAPLDSELGIALHTHTSRLLLRAPVSSHRDLTRAVRTAMRVKSAKRDGQPLKIQVNPVDDL